MKNRNNKYFEFAVYEAVKDHRLDVVERLVKDGVDPFGYVDAAGKSALDLAVDNNWWEGIKFFVRQPNQACFELKREREHYELIGIIYMDNWLTRERVNNNIKRLEKILEEHKVKLTIAFSKAAKLGLWNLIQEFISYPKAFNEVELNRVLLLAVHASVTDEKLFTVVEALLKAGANPDRAIMPDTKNYALHEAATIKNSRTVALLLKHNASLNKVNVENKTPIVIATELGHFECVMRMTRHEKESNNANQYNQALSLAIDKQAFDVAEALLQAGATFKNYPLHAAVINNDRHMIALLLRYKCDLSIRDSNNLTAVDIASKQKNWDIVNVLKHPYKFSTRDAKLILFSILMAQTKDSGSPFSSLPFEVIEHILTYAFNNYAPSFFVTADLEMKQLYIHSIKAFHAYIEKNQKPLSDQFRSNIKFIEKLAKTLLGIAEQKCPIERRLENAGQTIKTFVKSLIRIPKNKSILCIHTFYVDRDPPPSKTALEIIDLLIKFHLLSPMQFGRSKTPQEYIHIKVNRSTYNVSLAEFCYHLEKQQTEKNNSFWSFFSKQDSLAIQSFYADLNNVFELSPSPRMREKMAQARIKAFLDAYREKEPDMVELLIKFKLIDESEISDKLCNKTGAV